MNHDDVAFIDGIVTEYRERLLKVGYMSRTNRAQRKALSEAHSVVLSLPALARERVPAKGDPAGFTAFVAALEDLCKSYGVSLCVSGYDSLQVWPADEKTGPLHCAGLEDRT